MAKKKTAQKGKTLERLVIYGSLMVLCAFAGISLYKSGVISLVSQDEPGYRNVTLTDAVLACQGRAEKTFERSLRGLMVDDHSSRYDANQGKYLVFIQAQVQASSRREDISKFYVNCYVSGRSGRIGKFDTYEEKEVKTKAIRKQSENVFGWPL